MKNSAAIFSILLSGITAFAQTSVPVDSASIALSEVVVTGSNKSVNRDLLPYTVSVVSRNDLEATGQTQVLAAISGQVPSLFVSQRGIFGFGVSN